MFFNFFGGNTRNNNEYLTWKLKPVKLSKKSSHNYGGKIILPQYVLEELVMTETPPPYTFQISHSDNVFRLNCGVLEFTGKDDQAHLPEWMFQQLMVEGNTELTVSYRRFLKGTYVKLIPHTVDFLEIIEPKRELEKNLTNYQVLSIGDEILCRFDGIGNIRFTVCDVKPETDGIYVVDTDLNTEFAPPIGYQEMLEKQQTCLNRISVDANGCISMNGCIGCFYGKTKNHPNAQKL